CCGLKGRLNISAETIEFGEAFVGGFDNLLFVLENLSTVDFGQYSHDLAYLPAWRAEHLQTLRRGQHEHDALAANDSDRVGKALEGLEFESGEVEALELFGGVHKRVVSR